jgi:hypothetical protein
MADELPEGTVTVLFTGAFGCTLSAERNRPSDGLR